MRSSRRLGMGLKAIFWISIIAGLAVSSIPQSVLADDGMSIDDETSLNFYINGIYYYDPKGGSSFCDTIGSNTGEISGSGAGYEKLKNVVRLYGEYAMELQKKYGSPWEVIFAQMQIESQTGECTDCVASAVAELGYYNWLGITNSSGRNGDTEAYVSSSGRKWAMYASIESMMNAWAGPAVLRNGNYDDAFPYTDPNNYNLQMFVSKMLYHYAPPSENDTEGYIVKVMNLINGPIAEVRAEESWPSSSELAKEEGIQIGGEAGAGKIPMDADSSDLNMICGPEAGNLTSYVVSYAWPEYHAPNYFNMKPDYESSVNRRLKEGKYVGGGSHPGIDCGGFVTTLLQDSGFDPDYGGGGSVPTQRAYVISQGWQVVDDISNLQPGDVAFNAGNSHTFVYVGDIEGFDSVIASASYSTTGTSWRAPMAGKENMQNVTWYRKNN